MNIVRTLSARYLRQNRRRTAVTIIGVILSAVMLTAVFSLMSSLLRTLQIQAFDKYGNWQSMYRNVYYKDVRETTFPGAEELMISLDLGYAAMPDSQNARKPYYFVRHFDDHLLENMPLELLEGRLPESESEIVVSAHAITDGGAKLAVGDTITLRLGDRMATGGNAASIAKEIAKNNKIFDHVGYVEGERLSSSTTRTYTIVGIIREPVFETVGCAEESHIQYLESGTNRVVDIYYGGFSGFTLISWLDPSTLTDQDTVTVYTKAEGIPASFTYQVQNLAKELDVKAFTNDPVLGYMGGIPNDNTYYLMIGMSALFILITAAASVSLIYNTFSISVSERLKQFGMLDSIGASKKQKRGIVLWEAGYVSLLGIPVGLLLGLGVSALMVHWFDPMVRDLTFGVAGLEMTFSPLSLIGAVFFTLAVVFLSAYIPSARASRYTAIESIRQTADIRVKAERRIGKGGLANGKKRKISVLLARKNFKRSGKKYRATILSITISVVLYICVSAFYLYMSSAVDNAYGDNGIDMIVSVRDRNDATTFSAVAMEDRLTFLEKVSELDGIEQQALQRRMYFAVVPGQENVAQPVWDYHMENLMAHKPDDEFIAAVTGVGDEAFIEYCTSLNLNPEEYMDPEHPKMILINHTTVTQGGLKKEIAPFTFQSGDQLSLWKYENKDLIHEIEIGATAVSSPYSFIPNDAYCPFITNRFDFDGADVIKLVASDTVMESLASNYQRGYVAPYCVLYIDAENPIELEEEINQIFLEDPVGALNLNNIYIRSQTNRQTVHIVSVFVYSFVVLLTAVGVVNIFNTLSTNIALRRREFAMLKSVGMSPKQFNRMLYFESLLYAFKALLYGFIVSLILTGLLYNTMRGQMLTHFTLPWESFLICTVAVFVIVFLTMYITSRKVRHENIIEALKNENL